MYKIIAILLILGGLFILATIGSFSDRDITPDAVTMATTHNLWTGDVASLTDGRTPDIDPGAAAFEWDWIGLLAVSWPDTVRLATIRVYIGTMDQYKVFGYLGGGFTQEGFRVDVEKSVYGHEGVVPAGVTGWYEITCSPEFAIDNISFQVVGGAVIYEIEFLRPENTAIWPINFWGIKKFF